jgi:hypothetical protein
MSCLNRELQAEAFTSCQKEKAETHHCSRARVFNMLPCRRFA